MTLHIKTAEGWKPVLDHESIPVSDRVTDLRSAERRIRRDVFMGWTPTPNGKLSGENLHDFNLRVTDMVRDLCASLGIMTDNRVGIPL